MTYYKINLDLLYEGTQLVLSCKKGDTERGIAITLHRSGVPVILTKSHYAVFIGKKPDGNNLINDCVIDMTNNCIRYDFTPQTISAEGIVVCEIDLFDVMNECIASPTFVIRVRKDVAGGINIESTSEYNTLNTIINDIKRRLENGEFNGVSVVGAVLEKVSDDASDTPDIPDVPDVPDVPDNPDIPGVTEEITFTINGITYYANRGMTWDDWIDSSDNTIGCFTSGSAVMVDANTPLLDENGEIVHYGNTIHPNAAYENQKSETGEGTPETITFTIDGTTYQAIRGMTWRAWVNSDYNTDHLITTSGTAIMSADNTPLLLHGAIVGIANKIQANAAYTSQGASIDPGTPESITFTIDGVSYEAYSGMTWGEWIVSSDNTSTCFISGTAVMADENTPLLLHGAIVGIANKIQANAAYTSQGASIDPGTPESITFTIDGVSYEAYSGMTWGEWYESDYNTIGIDISGTAVMVDENTPLLLNGTIVGISNVIQDNGEYKRPTSGNEPGVTETITFTIDGQSYATYKGRRWGDWADSDENTSECYPYGEYIFVAENTLLLLNGESVKTTDFITSGADYTRQDSITFRIGHVDYKAIWGMTWYAWVNSHYNRDGFWIDEHTSCVRPNGNDASICVHTSSDNVEIKADDEITASGSYTVSTC